MDAKLYRNCGRILSDISPINTLVIKFASRCNLACTYCYEYAAGDDSWRNKPKKISLEIAEQIGKRSLEYASEVNLTRLNIVAHGGEPLMLGSHALDNIFATIKHAAAPLDLRLSVQTNGVLLTPDICKVLHKHRVLVGISLDGGKRENYRRIDHRGRDTWDATLRGIHNLRAYAPESFGGILCVVDPLSNPVSVIKALCDLAPPQIDLLQPFLTHDEAGTRRADLAKEFGEWMSRALNTWLSNSCYRDIKVRVFEDAFRAAMATSTRTDWFGPRKISYLVVESDGSYDMLDQLKVIGERSAEIRSLKMNVFTNPIREAAFRAESLLNSYHGNTLPTDCTECRHANSCGGSHLTSRYSGAAGFNNRSSYCEGLSLLLDEASKILKERDL